MNRRRRVQYERQTKELGLPELEVQVTDCSDDRIKNPDIDS